MVLKFIAGSENEELCLLQDRGMFTAYLFFGKNYIHFFTAFLILSCIIDFV